VPTIHANETRAHVPQDATRVDESLAQQYQRIAQAYERRRADPALRALDVAISLTTLTALAPLIALIAAAIRVTSGAPVLYRGSRVGRFGRIFMMYKFRTLTADAEHRLGPYYGEELTRRTEREVTAIGRLLRASYLDELPQLWNVLQGDMSIVGPRPIRPSFFEELTTHVPQYWQRLVVRPGVTGFAQVRVTREDPWTYKLAHDLEYIADRSVHLYLAVMAATLRQIIGGSDAAMRGEEEATAELPDEASR
jgi:lipopolysaccharide/colanic/teichoic acid biosynthesis glycosyltransferase